MSQSLNILKSKVDELPNNIEAEQSVIGSILLTNEIFDDVSLIISNKSFYDPIHKKIFEALEKLIYGGMLANPITLKNYFVLILFLLRGITALFMIKATSRITEMEYTDARIRTPHVTSSGMCPMPSDSFHVLLSATCTNGYENTRRVYIMAPRTSKNSTNRIK